MYTRSIYYLPLFLARVSRSVSSARDSYTVVIGVLVCGTLRVHVSRVLAPL